MICKWLNGIYNAGPIRYLIILMLVADDLMTTIVIKVSI